MRCTHIEPANLRWIDCLLQTVGFLSYVRRMPEQIERFGPLDYRVDTMCNNARRVLQVHAPSRGYAGFPPRAKVAADPVAARIAAFLGGESDGSELLHALYDHVLNEPIPAAMRALLDK